MSFSLISTLVDGCALSERMFLLFLDTFEIDYELKTATQKITI